MGENRKMLQALLRDGEDLLWTAQPSPRPMAVRELPALIVGLVVPAILGGAIYLIGTDTSAASDYFLGIMVLLVVVSATPIISPFWAYRAAKDTVYAITNKRIIVIQPRFLGSSRARFYNRTNIKMVEPRLKGNDFGDLIFATRTQGHVHLPEGFWGIGNLDRVEALILEMFGGKTL